MTPFEILDEKIGFDYVLEQYKTPDFTEFVVSTGGDVCTYRVYNDGSVYAK